MNNMFVRAISGFLLVAVIVCSILFNAYAFAIVFSAVTALAVREFHRMTAKDHIQVNEYAAMAGGLILFWTLFIHASQLCPWPLYSIYGFYILIMIITELYRKKTNPLHNWAYFIFGQVYVALPFSLLNLILFVHDWQPMILLALFVTIWVNDTGAYLFGISFGKHRLFERISPKKSWEGFAGGALAALASGYFFSLIIPEITLIQWFIFSEIVVIFGTFGDLIESLMKRTVQIKDSGNLIPGHGGMLDRFDSLILAAPAIYLYLTIILGRTL